MRSSVFIFEFLSASSIGTKPIWFNKTLLPGIFESLGSIFYAVWIILASPSLLRGLKYPRAHTATIDASGIPIKRKHKTMITTHKFFCDNFIIHML